MIKISKHTKNCTKQTLGIKRIGGQTLSVGGVYCYGKIQLEKGMKRTWTNLIIVVWALLLGKSGEYYDTIEFGSLRCSLCWLFCSKYTYLGMKLDAVTHPLNF